MRISLCDKIIEALKQASQHNENTMVKPEVILWSDPDSQWLPVINKVQDKYNALFVFGEYLPEKKQGPAIWLKCVIAQTIQEPVWDNSLTPVIYLPGISKDNLRNITDIGLELQPLVEYQYTGALFTQYNGKDWTIMAFLQNAENGLGLQIAQDNATKEAVIKSLPVFFEYSKESFNASLIDSDFLNSLVFPNANQYILKWMCEGDKFMNSLGEEKETFINICKTRFAFEPNYKNIKAIAEKLGSQKDSWKSVWCYYANSPSKFPEIKDLLEQAKPADLGAGMFAITEESWPSVNQTYEDELRKSLEKLSTKDFDTICKGLAELDKLHSKRRNWVWSELGYSPLVFALKQLLSLSEIVKMRYPFGTIEELIEYYISLGYEADTLLRKSFTSVKTDVDKKVIQKILDIVYKPWLERITLKFQDLLVKDNKVLKNFKSSIDKGTNTFYLFVDAFRFELAKEFEKRIEKIGFETKLNYSFSALPSLTASSKPKSSPVSNKISIESECIEFVPQFVSGRPVQIADFRKELSELNFITSKTESYDSSKSYWVEIGEIDKKGHHDQSGMLKIIDVLFDQIHEVIETAVTNGIKRIKIVTDHGWLMLPGGLPNVKLSKDLTETRWGRCALIKEGVKTDLLQLPWEWNPSVFVAYAPGISFFRINDEYAHGGISIQECLIPELIIEAKLDKPFSGRIKNLKWVNLKCSVETEAASDGYLIDIRTKYTDEATSIVLSKNRVITDNKCTLMVDDSAISSAAFVVLTNENGRIIDKQNITIGD